jgi:5-methyltetrahydrofolate--homocysteine methyltransferase
MCSGTDIETFAVILESLNADVIGVSCQSDPLPVLNELEKHTNCFLSVSLNEKNNNNLESFLKQANVDVISTKSLESINTISKLSKGKKVIKRTAEFPFRFTCASKTVKIGSGLPFIKIGERINPTGRKVLAESLSEGRIDIILKDALTQFQMGADALDVNVGAPLADEPEIMKLALKEIQQKVDLPLVIDSSSSQTIENGLKMYAGKVLVNSINAKEKTLNELLPIIKKYGASVIALTISDSIPENSEKRLELAKSIVDACKNFGIKESDIIIDVAALAIGTMPDSGQEVLNAIKMIKDELGLPVSIGVSNTSFGLPERTLAHNTFLVMAMAMGLDTGILNVLDPQTHELIAAASMFCGRDKYCMNYIKTIRSKKK